MLFALCIFSTMLWPSLSSVSDEIDWDAPAPSTPLLIAGKKFPLDFLGGEFTIHGSPLIVHETANSGLGTGLTVWDGSVVLAKYLEARHKSLQGQRVIELGCGPALAGLAASALGAEVTLTDLAYALDGVRAAVDANAAVLKGAVHVAELDWFEGPEKSEVATFAKEVDLCIAADVVWVEELIPALARTLGWIARRGGSTKMENQTSPPPSILVAHQTRARASDELFSACLLEEGLIARPLSRSDHHPSYEDPAIEILSITPVSAEGNNDL
jgi:hypothetical protein